MRTISIHHESELNKLLSISADVKHESGASHVYKIGGDRGAGLEVFADIEFQRGALSEAGFNGVSDESVLSVLIDRLRGFQSGPFSCRENALAITKMEEALHWLNARTKDRKERGVEGKSIA